MWRGTGRSTYKSDDRIQVSPFGDYPSDLMQIPLSGSELQLPDMPEDVYYRSNQYLRDHLRRVGDRRWKLPPQEFEQEFYLTTNKNMTEIQKAMRTCPIEAFGASPEEMAASVSPAAISGNSFIDAISGLIKGVTPAVVQRVAPTQRTITTQPAATSNKNTMLLVGAGALVVVLLLSMSRR
jgi:hypothetical protein